MYYDPTYQGIINSAWPFLCYNECIDLLHSLYGDNLIIIRLFFMYFLYYLLWTFYFCIYRSTILLAHMTLVTVRGAARVHGQCHACATVSNATYLPGSSINVTPTLLPRVHVLQHLKGPARATYLLLCPIPAGQGPFIVTPSCSPCLIPCFSGIFYWALFLTFLTLASFLTSLFACFLPCPMTWFLDNAWTPPVLTYGLSDYSSPIPGTSPGCRLFQRVTASGVATLEFRGCGEYLGAP